MVRVEQNILSRKRFSLNEIVDYVRSKEYPNDMDKAITISNITVEGQQALLQ